MKRLSLSNRQRRLGLDVRLLRRMTQTALDDLFRVPHYQLDAYLVGPQAMARLNERFLQHAGPTDVITFAYSPSPGLLHGEIFVCPDEAVRQAGLFGTTWQSELVRYLVHGILHLLGHDDKHEAARRKMKRLEDRILRQLASLFSLNELGSRPES